MEDLRNKYKQIKCCKCNNRNASSMQDKCDMRVFQYGNYVYCKCCNMSGNDKELKEKVM